MGYMNQVTMYCSVGIAYGPGLTDAVRLEHALFRAKYLGLKYKLFSTSTPGYTKLLFLMNVTNLPSFDARVAMVMGPFG